MLLPEPVATDLCQRIIQARPASLLLIADRQYQSPRYCQAAGDTCRIDTRCPAEATSDLNERARFALAIAIDPASALSRRKATQLLGRLRDLVATSVLVVAPTRAGAGQSNPWSHSDFIALGFTRARGYAQLDCGYAIYRYNIYDYKTTPSWLNARYWANPERWGKQRW